MTQRGTAFSASAKDRKIVAFGCTARKDNGIRFRTNRFGDLRTRLFDSACCLDSGRMVLIGWIAVEFRKVRPHRLEYSRIDWGCRVIVEIDELAHAMPPCCRRCGRVMRFLRPSTVSTGRPRCSILWQFAQTIAKSDSCVVRPNAASASGTM